MRKKLTILHTTLATTTTIPAMIRELYPDEFDIVNVLDDSLLNDIKCSGRMSASVIERFIQYACIAKNNGSDALLLVVLLLAKQRISPESSWIYRYIKSMSRWRIKR